MMTVLLIPMQLVEPYFTTTGMPHIFWVLAGLAPMASAATRRAQAPHAVLISRAA